MKNTDKERAHRLSPSLPLTERDTEPDNGAEGSGFAQDMGRLFP